MSFLAGFEPAIGCLHSGICPANRALTVHSTHLIAAHDAIESFLSAMTGIIACGAPCRIRTCDLGIRSPLLYPTELMARFLACLSRHCTPIASLWLLSFYLSYSYLKVRVPCHSSLGTRNTILHWDTESPANRYRTQYVHNYTSSSAQSACRYYHRFACVAIASYVPCYR